jgi:hypothetical protein
MTEPHDKPEVPDHEQFVTVVLPRPVYDRLVQTLQSVLTSEVTEEVRRDLRFFSDLLRAYTQEN